MKNIINVDFQNTINSGLYCVANNTNDLYLILTPALIQKTNYRVEVTDVNKQVHTSNILELNANNQIEYQVDSSYFNGAGVMKIRLLSDESNSYYIVFNCIKFTNEDLTVKYINGEYNFSIKSSSVGTLIDLIYPVGAQIYNASKDFNPNEYYPGTTWVRIKGYVLAGINEGDTDTNVRTSFSQGPGKTIGSKWLQQHSHQQKVAANEQGNVYRRRDYSGEGNAGEYQQFLDTFNTGDGDGQNIQPTYLTYIWERTA